MLVIHRQQVCKKLKFLHVIERELRTEGGRRERVHKESLCSPAKKSIPLLGTEGALCLPSLGSPLVTCGCCPQRAPLEREMHQLAGSGSELGQRRHVNVAPTLQPVTRLSKNALAGSVTLWGQVVVSVASVVFLQSPSSHGHGFQDLRRELCTRNRRSEERHLACSESA